MKPGPKHELAIERTPFYLTGARGSRDGEEKEDLMMRNRTSGQAAFLTAQLSNKKNCQTIRRPDDDHDPLQQQQRAGGSTTYLLQPKPEKRKKHRKRPSLGKIIATTKKTDDKRTTTAAPRLRS
ncbi:unnamed protein product [Sphagnum troendelagicum]|uniref:Uncharacterized protein n=1 Tax=Sphagnum troendelagicum TaxID=128251 RepID=A0ABP0U890_9BRYO